MYPALRKIQLLYYNNLIVKSRMNLSAGWWKKFKKGNKNVVLKFKLGTGESFKLDMPLMILSIVYIFAANIDTMGI